MLFLLMACTALSPWKTAQDRAGLAEAATTYWTSIRWGDALHASVFLESPEQRTQLARFMADPPWRMTDVQILSAEVGNPLPKEEHPLKREGIVLVRLEYYSTRIGKVETETIEQHWLKAAQGWEVDPMAWSTGAIW